MSILDYRTGIIDGRASKLVASYIPKWDQRRLKANNVLDYYMYGDAKHALNDLSNSHSENWTDPAPVFLLASTYAQLTTLGMRFANMGEDEDQIKKINRYTRRTKLFRIIREGARYGSIFGDTVLEARWDKRKNLPVIEKHHPTFYHRAGDDNVVLCWGEEGRDNELYIRQYLRGPRGKKGDDGVVVYDETKIGIGVREGWVKKDMRTGMNNQVPLEDRLEGDYEPTQFTDIPVICIPNNEEDIYGFGQSDFWNALGLIDNWVKIITDQNKQSDFLMPPIIVWGDRPPGKANSNGAVVLEYKPGKLYYLGQNGGVDVPNFENMMKAGNTQKDLVWSTILQTIGLAKAMLGDVGEVSNRRDREVRLMYAPGANKINNRREDMIPYWEDLFTRLDEVWAANDIAGYTEIFGENRLNEVSLAFDDILPEDVKERVEMINTVRDRGGLDRATYTKEAIDGLRIDGDPEDIAAKAGGEEQTGLGFDV